MAYNYSFPQQNIQPLFPQPQGNVYSINSTLEVANVPASAGLSVALCLPENVMYVKTMQNGTPQFWAYSISPYENKPQENKVDDDNVSARLDKIEEQILELQKLKKKDVKEDWEL